MVLQWALTLLRNALMVLLKHSIETRKSRELLPHNPCPGTGTAIRNKGVKKQPPVRLFVIDSILLVPALIWSGRGCQEITLTSRRSHQPGSRHPSGESTHDLLSVP